MEQGADGMDARRPAGGTAEAGENAATRQILSVDFDGVLHRYSSGWQGPEVIPDPPVAGAIPWLRCMLRYFAVVICSSRCRYAGGDLAIYEWLVRQGMTPEELEGVEITSVKPAAHVSLDDRGWTFTGPGSWPTAEQVRDFVPWHKRR